jgi:hypothetical protein
LEKSFDYLPDFSKIEDPSKGADMLAAHAGLSRPGAKNSKPAGERPEKLNLR